MDLQSSSANEILYVSFNQDCTCFVCGTESGFRVYSTDPFRLTHRRDFEPGGGLGVIAMLFRTNILAFSGGAKGQKFQPQKVVLWDDRQATAKAELSFRSPVRAIKMRRDLLVVVVERKVYVYGFRRVSVADSIETISNPKGLCCLSVGTDRVVLACPGMQQGGVLVVFYPRSWGDLHGPLARDRTIIVAAHEAPIASMSIDPTGTLLATASDKGTIVRVHDTASGERLHELRRGADRAEIHSLTFSAAMDWLAVSSDKGTIHIFAIHNRSHTSSYSTITGTASENSNAPGNAKSSLQRISRVLPSYFSSEWSFAQFRVPEDKCICAFGSDPNTIVVVCANGHYYKARFDPNRGGEMVREDFAQFIDGASDHRASISRSSRSEPEPSIVSQDAEKLIGSAEKAAHKQQPDESGASATSCVAAATTPTAAEEEKDAEEAEEADAVHLASAAPRQAETAAEACVDA